MIKVEATEQFTLGEFDKIKNLVRANPAKNEKGRLYAKDVFECDKEMVEYLTGKNAIQKAVVKVIQVAPNKVEEVETPKKKKNVSRETKEEPKEEKKKTTRKRKLTE